MDNLTDEQIDFADYVGGAFVHACPGAGKTRTIIARLIRKSLPPRRGVAVLSFTNTAVDEFRERCRKERVDGLIRYPNFTGTVDSFIRQFILPSCFPNSVDQTIVVQSWESFGVSIRLPGQHTFPGVSLDRFDPDTNRILPESIGHAGLRNHVVQNAERYQNVAANRRRGLLAGGILSAADARIKALELIRTPDKGRALGRALAARFEEVMLDEGQDCNPSDLQILQWLRQFGTHVTFVCDPDQNIYQFRLSDPVAIQGFRATFPEESHRQLTGNFRSSPPICRRAATLKSANGVDRSLGETFQIEHPVLLLSYAGQSVTSFIGTAFLERVRELQLPESSSIVVAHAERVAMQACGAADSESRGNSRIEVLAKAVADFWTENISQRSKEFSVQTVELQLLDLMGQRQDGEHLSRAISRASVDRRLLRRRAASVLMNLPNNCADDDNARAQWINFVRARIGDLGLALPPGTTIRAFYRSPPNAQWSGHLQRSPWPTLKYGKIHEIKGREFAAVCVVIPPNRRPGNFTNVLVDAWSNRIELEAKRVIYVGVTRAESLCCLALPSVVVERCTTILTGGNVPFEVKIVQ